MSLLLVAAAVLGGLWLFNRAAAAAINRIWPPLGDTVQAVGLDVHVLDTGRSSHAPALVLIHGASGNLRDPVEALGVALAGRYRFIGIDRPGHGHTTRGGLAMSDPAHQADVVAAVLAELRAEPAVVLGHSWGAAVAAALAQRHPRSVAGLVLVAPASHPWPGGVSARSRFFALPQLGRAMAELVVVPLGLLLAPAAIRAIFLPEKPPDHYARRIGVLLAVRPTTFVANARDVADLYRHIVRLSAGYGAIRAPTEILTADVDPIVAPAIHAYGLARDIPGARLTVSKGGGHMLHWTRPQEVAAAIDRVLARSHAGLSAAE